MTPSLDASASSALTGETPGQLLRVTSGSIPGPAVDVEHPEAEEKKEEERRMASEEESLKVRIHAYDARCEDLDYALRQLTGLKERIIDDVD